MSSHVFEHLDQTLFTLLSSQSSWWNEKCAQKMLGGDCGQWDRGWWGLRPVGTVSGGDHVWWGLRDWWGLWLVGTLVGRSLLEALGRDGMGLSTAEPDEVPARSVTRLLGWIPEGQRKCELNFT